MNRPILILGIALGCANVFSQGLNIADFEPLLAPVATGQQLGAHGSTWQTELFVHNHSNEPVIFAMGEPVCLLVSCPGPYATIPASATRRYALPNIADVPFFGGLFYVERNRSKSITMTLRLRETSRNPSGLGTNIPIVRESELIAGTVQLLNVPLSPLHRINVRIFEVDRVGAPEVMVRIFRGDDLVWTERRSLWVPFETPFSEQPAEDALFNVENRIPPSACCDPVRIEIEPLNPGRYWAYATLVNNATQDVLLITPE